MSEANGKRRYSSTDSLISITFDRKRRCLKGISTFYRLLYFEKIMKTPEQKFSWSVNFVRSIAKFYGHLYLAYSGGKDSELCYTIMKEAKVPFTAVYNSTTIDRPGTIAWVKRHDCVYIQRPKLSFFDLMKKIGQPSFARRFCCRELKERYIARNLITGVRRDESKKRADRYKCVGDCFRYSAQQRTEQFFPIAYYSDEDVETIINGMDIRCHPCYYRNGHFDVSVRLGCLGCPLPWDRSIDDFREFPRLVRAWCRSIRVYRDTHPTSNAIALFDDEFEMFAHNLFFHSFDEFKAAKNSMFGADFKLLLEDYFHINLDY